MNLSDAKPDPQELIEKIKSSLSPANRKRDKFEKGRQNRIWDVKLTAKWRDGKQSYDRRNEVNQVMGIELLLKQAIEQLLRLGTDYPEGEGVQIAIDLFTQAAAISTPEDNSY